MSQEICELLRDFKKYLMERRALLRSIEKGDSCRDPLAEFSEVLVAKLLGATPAKNRVQKGFDLLMPSGEKVEVKYLANPKGKWRNWHTIRSNGIWQRYALVCYEDLFPKVVFIFPRAGLKGICQALKKRHGNTDTELQFTKTNYDELARNRKRFEELGVRIIPLDRSLSGR